MSTTTSLLRTASAVGLIAAAALSPSIAQAQAGLDSPLLNHAAFAAWAPPVFGLVAAAAGKPVTGHHRRVGAVGQGGLVVVNEDVVHRASRVAAWE